ncbi:MAG: ABC transporter transmembrane domain-containing protein [Rhodobacteraceae bacterium]|nr:ABC transporter transmembrane domain-containing protein [Paracoccaceae bacterium]
MPLRLTNAAAVSADGSQTLRQLRPLLPFLLPYRLKILAAAFALTVTACLTLIMPLMVGNFVDSFGDLADDNASGLFATAFLIAALLAFGSGIRFALVTMIGERVVADIRKAVFARTISLSPAFFETVMTGEILSRINTDTTLVLTVVGSTVSVALRSTLTLFGGLALMFITSPKLTLLCLLVVPLVLVPVLTLGRRLRRVSRDNQDHIAESSADASELLLAVQSVQANTHEQKSISRFDGIVERSVRSAYRRIRIRASMTIAIILLAFCGVVAVVWTGTLDVGQGRMSIGDLTQFVIFAVLVAGSVAALSEVWGELVRAAGATDRLSELLQAEDPVTDPERPRPPATPARGSVTFDNVTFRYPMRPEAKALKELTFTVKAGETVALVGPSGAGKSTIFQLLLRFFDPQNGRILIDGTDIRSMRRSEFRRLIALVAQDPAIFADSARENIRFGNPAATDNEVEQAAESAAIHEFLTGLPQGYDSWVGERGIMLSGGQKQRIAIARAILRDAPLLLLDEATSSLDSESEQVVQEAFEELSRSRTTIIVAHRLATVRRADRILVFDRGVIVAEGKHAELAASEGLYSRLAQLQFISGDSPPPPGKP